jgi:epoxide hydrolase
VNDAVTPFRVSLSEAAIDDLRERLRRTRWPEPATAGGWSQGTPLAWVRELCRYWLEDYDFGAAQERLNQFPQFQTVIDGLGICFVHVRSPHPDAVPLLLRRPGQRVHP